MAGVVIFYVAIESTALPVDLNKSTARSVTEKSGNKISHPLCTPFGAMKNLKYFNDFGVPVLTELCFINTVKPA